MYSLPPVPLCREMAVLVPRRLRSQLAFQLQGHPAGPSLSWETVSECHGHNLLSVTCTLLSKLASKLQPCFGDSVNLSGPPVLGLHSHSAFRSLHTPTHLLTHTLSYSHTHSHILSNTLIHTLSHTLPHNSPSHTHSLTQLHTHTHSCLEK